MVNYCGDIIFCYLHNLFSLWKDVFQTAIEALSAVVLRNRETSQLAVNVLNFLSVLSEVLSSGHSPQVKLGAAEW